MLFIPLGLLSKVPEMNELKEERLFGLTVLEVAVEIVGWLVARQHRICGRAKLITSWLG